MPRGDGTGPAGQGPATGRGAGYCAGSSEPGFTTSGGAGMGRNRRPFRATGGGFRNRQVHRDTGMPGWVRFISELLNNRTAGAGDDRTDLRNRAADMQAQLDDLKQRLADQDQG